MNYKETADLVMSRLLAVKGSEDIHDHLTLDTWEWPQGVAVYAMMKLYLSTGDQAILQQVNAWYHRRIAAGLPSPNINTTAPFLAMTFLYEATRETMLLELIKERAAWIMTELPRTQEGGLQHITSDDENKEQIWDDTLYMTVLFLYRAGLLLNDRRYTEEAKYQFLLHIKYLQSQETGLWYHGYCFTGRHHFAGALWARGNSWFTAGAADFLEWLENDDAVCRLIRETFISQCRALAACQDRQSGLWRTLLNDSSSYVETSGSAAIAYGIKKGIRLGLLRKEEFGTCAEKALQGVLAMINRDGTARNVSYGTPMGHTLDFYKEIPVQPTAYGQGLVFLMLTEYMNE